MILMATYLFNTSLIVTGIATKTTSLYDSMSAML